MFQFIKEGKLFDYSPETIAAVVKELERFKQQNAGQIRILECGCGDGNVTEQLLKVMGKNDAITCVEMESRLAIKAKKKFQDDARVEVYSADMSIFATRKKFDFVLNMIPGNPFVVALDKVWTNLLSMCQPEAIIITLPYIVNPMRIIVRLPIKPEVTVRWKNYKAILKKYQYWERISLRNWPPCRVVVLKK